MRVPFDVVIPSLPGSGFSGKPAGTGWALERIARAWAELCDNQTYMKQIGLAKQLA